MFSGAALILHHQILLSAKRKTLTSISRLHTFGRGHTKKYEKDLLAYSSSLELTNKKKENDEPKAKETKQSTGINGAMGLPVRQMHQQAAADENENKSAVINGWDA
jgi:hypothetical protein